jgi:hypothetical protein
MLRALAALLLLAPAVVPSGQRTGTLHVSVQVRRAVTVSVQPTAGAPSVVVSTAAGAIWSGAAGAASGGAVRVEPSAAHPGYVVVTVLADLKN